MTPSLTTSANADFSAIHPALVSALAKQGYETLTAVQLSVLGTDAHGQDLLVSAQTGSGKTVAFGLAIAPTLLGDAVNFPKAERPLGLIIAPTRELALQVQRELGWLYADAGVIVTACVGGMDIRNERRTLMQGAHIVVGTPGRLRDHVTRGALDLTDLRAVVLDEADEMLDMGFREDLEFILAATPEIRRTLMFSATVPKPIAQLAKTYQRDAVRLTATAASEPHADIDYQMVVTPSHERESAIINTLLYFDSGSAIVFCHTREAVKLTTIRLAEHGFAVVTLSGELSQNERTNALQAMRDGRARVCVATDVAARGIDLPNLDLVIHADVPSKPDTLLHRSGRTGRAGRKGVCVLIVPVRRYAVAARVLEMARVEATTRGVPTSVEIEARNREQILQTAVATPPPTESEAAFAAQLLARVSPEQLAAAYLRQQVSARPSPEHVTEIQLPSKGGKPREREAGRDRDIGRDRESGRDRDFSERRPRPDRDTGREEMSGAGWFTLSLGRKHRADPKWILPLICKAGDVSRKDVGSIKIFDGETRFEISSKKSADFAAKIARDGSGESNATIKPATGVPQEPRPRDYPTKSDAGPRFKVRSDKGEKLADKGEKLGTDRVSDYRPEKADTPPRPKEPWSKSKPKAKYAGEARTSDTREKRQKGPDVRPAGVKPWKSKGPSRGN